jgi:8-oxo-dGTP diphosphatase
MIHVVAAVIERAGGDILLTQRAADAHQGGLWEFPGGKVAPNEAPELALARELQEELGLELQQARPLIRIRHQYPDKSILLDVWRVEHWRGPPWGREGQPLQWCPPARLRDFAFPAANYPILNAVQLPNHYLITPEPTRLNDRPFFYRLEHLLNQGFALIQLRAKQLYAASHRDYCHFAERVLQCCEAHQARLLLNADTATVQSVGSHGLHLTSARLHEHQARPLPAPYWLAASCHQAADLTQAQQLKTDLVVIGAVRPTRTHPDTTPLGWQRFFTLTEQSHCPAYALGGMQITDLACVYAHGGQGIAAIRGLWGEET